mgnify:CR=1 FL=1
MCTDMMAPQVEGTAKMRLPMELLFEIVEYLDSQEISAVCRSNKSLHIALEGFLYRHDAQHSNNSALFWAVAAGHQTTLEKAIKYDPKFETRTDINGRTPLTLAATNGHVDIVERLISCSPNMIDLGDVEKRTPLQYAAMNGHVAVLEKLLACEVDVNSRDVMRRTALSWAVVNGHVAVAGVLLAVKGILRNVHDIGMLTPLSLAVSKKRKDVVNLLLQGR